MFRFGALRELQRANRSWFGFGSVLDQFCNHLICLIMEDIPSKTGRILVPEHRKRTQTTFPAFFWRKAGVRELRAARRLHTADSGVLDQFSSSMNAKSSQRMGIWSWPDL